jgi:hypothetical protein
MEPNDLTAFDHNADELATLLAGNATPFPEFAAARRDLAALRADPRTRAILAHTEPLIANIGDIPQTTYTRYRAFARTGDREPYQSPYYLKREMLHAAALRLILGQDDFKDAVHDYLWSICEESTWVVPAHTRTIDLMAAETAFGLAEILALAGPALDVEVRRRVSAEIDRRIFVPFLHASYDLRWFGGGDNWNGVCSGAVGGALLYLEPEPERLAEGLALILTSLKAFLANAFEEDGSSTEGVGYWQYGLQYVVIFAELLRARTNGTIDLLASPRVRQIAAFPGKLLLPSGRYVSFADSAEEVPFIPGIIARLAQRAGAPSLLSALAHPAPLAPPYGISMSLRDLLWWDGNRSEAAPIEDATLPASGIARLVGTTADGSPLVVVVKAGHNAENHNHNDIGSFIVRVGDETFLTDPGPGHYDRDYFRDRRYDNVFANSYGHSVPRIGGHLQRTGHDFAGTLLASEHDDTTGQKTATIEFARAYPVATLIGARRSLTIATSNEKGGTVWLHDTFRFSDDGSEVEEALLTWLPVEVEGVASTIIGRRHHLRLTIEQPAGAQFALDALEQESRANQKPEVLQRLHFVLPPAPMVEVRVRMEVVAGAGDADRDAE